MLEYLYQIENLFRDVQTLKTIIAILATGLIILFIIVIVNGQSISKLEKQYQELIDKTNDINSENQYIQ